MQLSRSSTMHYEVGSIPSEHAKSNTNSANSGGINFEVKPIEPIKVCGNLETSPNKVVTILDHKETTNCILPQSSSEHQSPLLRNGHVSLDNVCATADHKENGDFLKNSSEYKPSMIEGISCDVILKQQARIISNWPDTTSHAREIYPEFCAMYECIKERGLPNFLGAKLPVESGLVIHKWEELLESYHDKDLVQLLKYGWPVGYHADQPPASVDSNHQSAIRHPNHVNAFIQKELQHHAILGPFKEPPFTPWCWMSPIMTRPKKESQERRIIMDLSFPHGFSPNDGISIYDHFGKDISYSLPSISDLINKLQLQGPGSWVWKADLSRAYRQIRIDPLDTPLLGFRVEDSYYIDLCPSFGCKSSSAACQRVANAVTYLMGKNEHFVLAYLDDYAGTHIHHLQALQGYTDFVALTKELGLKLASHKCLPPCQRIEWLGFQVDTVQMTISIPKTKLEQVVNECSKWSTRKRANRKMIQSILGKLIYISACVEQGRKFVSRILDTLRSLGDRNWTWINEDFRKDIEWFQRYGAAANGIHLYKIDRQIIIIECDSSTTGAGGNSGKFCYSWKYPAEHTEKFRLIHQLEAINVVVAFRTLAHRYDINSAQVIVMTDNSASSFALETGKTKDRVLASCSRELWLEAAKSDHRIQIRHKPGSELVLADALSRRTSEKNKAELADSIILRDSLTVVSPCLNDYVFFTIDL